MRFVSFDPFRTLHLPDVTYIKPELFFERIELIQQAECLLFPPYWLINTIVYSLRKPVFPSPASYHLGHDKIEMTRAFQAVCPAHIPRTHILPNDQAASDCILSELNFPFVAKAVRSAQGVGVYLIRNRQDWAAYRQAHEVLYVQEQLPIDRDIRIIVVGECVIAGYWRVQPQGGFHNNVAQGGQIRYEPLPAVAVNLVQQVSRQLQIDHAGFDIAMVDGHPYLFEFNRLFGNQGLVQQGVRIESHIADWLNRSQQQPPLKDTAD